MGLRVSQRTLKRFNPHLYKTVSKLQLLMAHSLEGATMPEGQMLAGPDVSDEPTFEEDFEEGWLPTFEDWLKSKGRAEDGENSGPS
jgi:hypothetical protein